MRETSFLCVRAKSLQSCLTLCDPMDCSPPGSYVHGILQARILEWVAMPSWFLTQGSNPNLLCLLHWQVGSLPLGHLGSPDPFLIWLNYPDNSFIQFSELVPCPQLVRPANIFEGKSSSSLGCFPSVPWTSYRAGYLRSLYNTMTELPFNIWGGGGTENVHVYTYTHIHDIVKRNYPKCGTRQREYWVNFQGNARGWPVASPC